MAGWGGKRGHAVGAYRSGLEQKNMEYLEKKGIKAAYEEYRIPYVIPASDHTYMPDFLLPNGIIVETKGIWDSDDRKKHQLIREQYPMLDIRMVFSSSKAKLYKGSKTTYAMWCEKHGIKFADKWIPIEWLKEPKVIIPQGILIPKKKKEK